jgi:hypothetical protein
MGVYSRNETTSPLAVGLLPLQVTTASVGDPPPPETATVALLDDPIVRSMIL